MNIFNWLFGHQSKKFDRSNITEKFKSFRRFQEAENKDAGRWDSETNLLVKYIVGTHLSPFVGDDNLHEARKLLREAGIREKII